jgi:hypothetical protein
MNGKIYPIGDTYVVQNIDTGVKHTVRKEDSNIPYVVASDVVYNVKDGFAIIGECETIAEIHNIHMGWICPRCNKVNAPFIKICDC